VCSTRLEGYFQVQGCMVGWMSWPSRCMQIILVPSVIKLSPACRVTVAQRRGARTRGRTA
jgi:hypothetical protein